MRLFSPGLIAETSISFTRFRSIPLHGKVVVKEGDVVEASTVIGFINPYGSASTYNLANELDISPFDVSDALLKKEGEVVFRGEVIAQARGLFSHKEFVSPEDGVLERVSRYTGWIIIRGLPIPILAGYPGVVERIAAESGVYIRSQGTLIQGIFGIGGHVCGPLQLVSGDIVLDADDMHPQYEGAVLVGGAKVSLTFLQRAARLGLKGVVTGGIDKRDLDEFLGYPLGVAVTGLEPTLTVVITEGFGCQPMRQRLLDLLKPFERQVAYLSGATQVRAGVIRPELFVQNEYPPKAPPLLVKEELSVGDMVRVTRAPYFGVVGKVVSTPMLSTLPTESTVLAVQVELPSVGVRVIPVANLEPLQGVGPCG